MNKHKYGYKKDKDDRRDRIHPNKALFAPRLPTIVDMTKLMPPVFDQGALGSCTANALVGLREFLAANTLVLSRLFLYYQERVLEGDVQHDTGSSLRDGMKALNTIGVCPEVDEPYVENAFSVAPSQKAMIDAGQFKISAYQRIVSLATAKVALAASKPVAFGFAVYESFESEDTATTGIIPMPKKHEQLLGGHAMLLVGYNDHSKWLIARNSWGTAWGKGGYCFMPYKVFTKYCRDAWVASK